MRDFFAIQHITAAGRRIKASEDIHQRRFAAAAWSHDRYKLAALDFKGNTAQSVYFMLAHLVGFYEIMDGNHCRLHAIRFLPFHSANDHLGRTTTADPSNAERRSVIRRDRLRSERTSTARIIVARWQF